MTKDRLAVLFNEWQRRYIEDPEGFSSSWFSIKTTLAEIEAGHAPSYGADCAAFIEFLDALVPA